MEYKVKFTEKCLEDIEEACQYIEEKLKAENAANRLRIKIKDSKKDYILLQKCMQKRKNWIE